METASEMAGLFGDDAKPVAKKKKAQPQSDGRVVALETAYIQKHQQRWGVTPMRKQVGYERKLIRGWADQLPDEELLALMDLYFDVRTYQRDDQVRRSDFTVAAFDRVLAHLRLLRVKQQTAAVSGRTAANIEAARSAVGRQHDDTKQ